jgi:ubiquitin-conjugating enzyme E2 Z
MSNQTILRISRVGDQAAMIDTGSLTALRKLLRFSKEVICVSLDLVNCQDRTLTPCAAIAVACEEKDVRSVKALIIGPPTTPYEYGFFEFTIKFGTEYPSKPPKVDAKTTNGGRTRFNPNIYAGGKVCLSILGTWHGERPGEEWSSAQGLESILWSIQSLMSSNPYENEPGYEHAKGKEDQKMNDLYCAKVCYASF